MHCFILLFKENHFIILLFLRALIFEGGKFKISRGPYFGETTEIRENLEKESVQNLIHLRKSNLRFSCTSSCHLESRNLQMI